MTDTTDDSAGLLVEELRQLLIRDWIDGINLLVSQTGNWVQVQTVGVSLGVFGTLLATLNDEAELSDPGSLSKRMTPGERSGADNWQYELQAARYPIDGTIFFSVKVGLPVSDLLEVANRLSKRPSPR